MLPPSLHLKLSELSAPKFNRAAGAAGIWRGFLLGVQLSPLNQMVAFGFGGVAVVPVVVAALAAEWRQ